MDKRFALKKLLLSLTAIGSISIFQYTFASAFQLWEEDGASIGNYHAGRAASAEDASIAYYNPAGLIRIKNQEAVFGLDSVVTDIRFRGTVQPNALGETIYPVTAQGGGYAFVPSFHYAAPISDRFSFGFSAVVPFGLQTDYGQNTQLRYAATKSSITVIDYTPSLGFAVTDKFSIGAGIDIQRLNAEFDQFATLIDPSYDTVSNNLGSDTAYGYHAGALYQFTPQTRLGIGYHSQVVHQLNGSSKFIGPLANLGLDPNGVQLSESFTANMTLPPLTTLSFFHSPNQQWDIMASLSYIQWSVMQDLILKNVAGIDEAGNVSNGIQVIIHEGFKNTWNYAIGANYHPNEKWIVRMGCGFDQTPTVDSLRSIQLPDSDRIAAAVGAHYQATTALGLDFGWTHIFVMNTRINNLTQQVAASSVTTNGTVRGSADVYGMQVKWDFV